jgi:uncharacterized membrane protein YoaK (UPF0700 family)
MPIYYLRRLTADARTQKANRHLGLALTFVAGATNAGGFLAVGQYTSHMTGIVSAMADDVALGQIGLVLDGLGGLLSFIAGAACSAVLFNWAKRRQLYSKYALSLLLEAVLLLIFGLLGANLAQRMGLFVPVTVTLLCFIMGLQNAIITKISKAEIRTTHVTGLVTDLGIELGKLFYWNKINRQVLVLGNRDRLRLLASLLAMFFVGGVVGAIGFKHLGYLSTVPLAAVLIMLAAVPIADDVTQRFRKQFGAIPKQESDRAL